MNRRLILLASTLLLASGAFATHREVTTVEVVQVPVYVSVEGRAVTGLVKTDFELYVNGKRQTVDYFDIIDFAGLPPAATSDPRQRRLYLLTFDLLFSSPDALWRAQTAAEEYIDKALPGDVFAVATYSSNRGFNFLAPFTRDRALLRRALQNLNTIAGDPLALTVATAVNAQAIDPSRTNGYIASASVNMMTSLTHEAARDNSAQPYRFLIEDEVRALTEVADRMAVFEGQKHVVLLSGGFNAGYVTGVHSGGFSGGSVQSGPAPNLTGIGSNGAPSFVSHSRMAYTTTATPGDPRLSSYLKSLYTRFTADSVFLDAIDIQSLRPGQTASSNESLFTLTRDTGGTVIERENSLNGAFQELADQQRVVYVLGFRPTQGGRRNSIRVNVRNAPAGAGVTYRPSYSNEIPLPASNDGLRLADILLNDIPQTGVSLSATATSTGKHAVVDVDIATRELLALSESKDVEAEALMYVYSGNTVVAFQQKRITLEAARVDSAKPVRVSQDFDLPPGHYAAKVLLRFEDQLGFVRSDFTIGE